MKAEVSTVGIIGGGQLGMFLAQACQKIGLITHIYSDTDDAPAKKYANKIIYGSFNDHKKLNEFRKKGYLINIHSDIAECFKFFSTITIRIIISTDVL